VPKGQNIPDQNEIVCKTGFSPNS